MLMRHLFILAALLVQPGNLSAANWGHWRGPTGNGSSSEAQPPTNWGESKNIRWKVPVPGRGSGSPVVWEDRVLLSRRSQRQGSLVSMGKGYPSWRSNYFASIARQERSGGNELRLRLCRMREHTQRTGSPLLPLVLMVNSFMLISVPGGCSVFEWTGLRFGSGLILER